MPYYYWWDPTYFLVIIGAVICLLASAHVNNTFKKYSKYRSMSGMTGAQAAQRILNAAGIYDVEIRHISGKLTDHYDPKANMLRLSADVYSGTSTAAIGVACHEVGHAIQYAQDYVPVKIRSAIIPVTNFGSKLSWPLVLAGLLLCSVAPDFIYLAYIGVACFALCAVFQLVTLPVEFNASSRAMQTIESMGILYGDELTGARRVLRAAAMTYVAALAVTLMQMLRLIIMVSSRDRRR